jgi:hypothetical protein
MPKRRESLSQLWSHNDSHISHLIFNELDLYAKDRQFYPVQNALFSYMTNEQWNAGTHKLDPPRYPHLSQGIFDYWFGRLVEEGYIEIDQTTRAIRCLHLEIIEKPDSIIP